MPLLAGSSIGTLETPEYRSLWSKSGGVEAAAKRNREANYGQLWGLNLVNDFCKGAVIPTVSRRVSVTSLRMELESGANMGFDLDSALGARMGSFVDGYQGFSVGESPVMLSLLNDEHMGFLGEITDPGTTHQIATMADEMTKSLQSALHLAPLPASAWETTEDMFNAVDHYLSPATKVIQLSLEKLGLSSSQAAAAVAALSILGSAAVLSMFVQRFGGDGPALPTEYDLAQLDGYYKRKPLVVARRFVEVSASLASFLLNVLADVLTNRWEENMPARAVQMREFTSSNGPAFIKVGQGASIRPDILPTPYLEEMQKLQDRVPEFSSAEARKILERELGMPVGAVFESVTSFDSPIAAASLGQVYKAKLKSTGGTVAVKVQRPKVLATVTRDLYVIRIILDLIGCVPVFGVLHMLAIVVLDVRQNLPKLGRRVLGIEGR